MGLTLGDMFAQAPAVRDGRTQGVGVVTLVGEQGRALWQIGDKLQHAGDVALLAGGQLQLDRALLLVDDRVDIRRETASGATQTSISPPLDV